MEKSYIIKTLRQCIKILKKTLEDEETIHSCGLVELIL